MTIYGVFIDDEAFWRDRLPDRLRRYDIQLEAYSDPEHALQAVIDDPRISFILCDYVFKGGGYSGVALLRGLDLESSGRALIRILTSVHAREEIGAEADGLRFVSKAETTQVIAQHIMQSVEGPKTRRHSRSNPASDKPMGRASA